MRPLYGRRRGPDDLARALTAFTRAIRCHRRLARLAPRFFDSSVVDQERHERLEQRRWMALWEPALHKVYGPEPADASMSDSQGDRPPLPSRRTQVAVKRQLAEWEFWMQAGQLALARHRQVRPHALISLTRLARLIEISVQFKMLAIGVPPPPESVFTSRCDAFMADLERAYGNQSGDADSELSVAD